jgi:hypothetical protein
MNMEIRIEGKPSLRFSYDGPSGRTPFTAVYIVQATDAAAVEWPTDRRIVNLAIKHLRKRVRVDSGNVMRLVIELPGQTKPDNRAAFFAALAALSK